MVVVISLFKVYYIWTLLSMSPRGVPFKEPGGGGSTKNDHKNDHKFPFLETLNLLNGPSVIHVLLSVEDIN